MSSIHTRPSTTATSAKASIPVPLHRRILFPNLPPSAPTPPLLPSASPELTTELYDFVALALRAYITPWWSKITRYDKEFLPHVSSIIVVALRTLTAAAAATDLSPVLFRDLPTVLTQHYVDYRIATAKLGTSYASGGAASLLQLFHQLQPHMAIDADARIDPVYIRQALDHVLKSCLPPEDYEPEVERAIVTEVIVKVILTDVMPRLVQPWFIHKMLLDLLGPSSPKFSAIQPLDPQPQSRRGPPSFHSIVVFFLSAVQTISGICLTLIQFYKQTVHTIKRANAGSPPYPASLPTAGAPNYVQCILVMLAEILTMRDRAASSTALSSLEIVTGFLRPFLDRLLPYLLYTHVLTEARFVVTLGAAKSVLFPNGYPGPPPVDPSPEEQAALKDQLVRRIEECIPPMLDTVLLGPTTLNVRHETICAALEPLSSPECNAHLLIFLLDLVLASLFPEMGVDGSVSHKDGVRRSFSSSHISMDDMDDSAVNPPELRPP